MHTYKTFYYYPIYHEPKPPFIELNSNMLYCFCNYRCKLLLFAWSLYQLWLLMYSYMLCMTGYMSPSRQYHVWKILSVNACVCGVGRGGRQAPGLITCCYIHSMKCSILLCCLHSICIKVSVSVSVCLCLPVCLSVCLFVCLSVCLYVSTPCGSKYHSGPKTCRNKYDFFLCNFYKEQTVLDFFVGLVLF